MLIFRHLAHRVFQQKQTVHIRERVLSKYRYSKLGFCASGSKAVCRVTSASYQSLSGRSVIKPYIGCRLYFVKMSQGSECPKPLEPKPFERLPKNVVPSHYNLFLKPDLEKFVFEGAVIVDVEVKEPTHKIVLNSLELNIKKVEIGSTQNDVQEPSDVITSNELETLTLIFANQVPAGQNRLCMSFSGEITDKMKGLYRSKYTRVATRLSDKEKTKVKQ